MDNKFLKDAEKMMNSEYFQGLIDAVEETKNIMPPIAEVAIITYDEFLAQGFTEEQSFQVAKEYVLRILLKDIYTN